jgi:hypothetical protein
MGTTLPFTLMSGQLYTAHWKSSEKGMLFHWNPRECTTRQCILMRMKINPLTDFMPSWWFVTYVDSILGLLHCVAVGIFTDVSGVHAAWISRVEVCGLVSFCVHIQHCVLEGTGERGQRLRGIGALSGPVRTVDHILTPSPPPPHPSFSNHDVK